MCLAGIDPPRSSAVELRVTDAPEVARLCNTCAVLCDSESELVASLLRSCADLLMRQHLMLQQANLVPRTEFQQHGSAHE